METAGTKLKCAWVTLVMLGDAYVPGALVLAQSLAELNTKFDTVCMVTPDVSSGAREALAVLFTSVVEVPYLTCSPLPPFPSMKQRRMYQRWIQHSFTRFNCLSPRLVPGYDKVVLLDCDMVFIKNCDHLFSIPAPAMTFSSAWAKPYCMDGSGMPNHYLDAKTGSELSHGEPVPHASIEKGLVDGFVGRASLVLFEPSERVYATITDILSAQGVKARRCYSGFDEQILADVILRLKLPVHNIHQQFNFVVGKEHWLVPPGTNNDARSLVPSVPIEPSVYQWYGVTKPWQMDEASWPDLAVWRGLAENVIHFHPALARWIPG
jgi:lipopolysaccharide biosynthesis glycosyltransferase